MHHLNVAADHVHPFMETVFFLGFFHSSIIIMPDWYEFNPICHNGEKTIIHRERVDLQRRADLSGNKVYHIRKKKKQCQYYLNLFGALWKARVRNRWSYVLSGTFTGTSLVARLPKTSPSVPQACDKIVACIFIFSARSRISLRRAQDEVRARLARSRALQPIPVVKQSSKLDMAADPQPDWLSCLPSSWSYGVTRDGRIFFIK